jgi:hypothetical protein
MLIKRSAARLGLLLLVGAALPLVSAPASALTVCGNILTNTTWTVADNPVNITCDTYVYPGVTLQIDPGVNVRVGLNLSLSVRGTLNAAGTSSSHVTFDWATPLNKWAGIVVMNPAGGQATFSYTDFSHAYSAITEQCCFGAPPITVLDSSFSYNDVGIGGYTGQAATVRRTTFSNNTYALTQADRNVYDSTFTNNTYGLFNTERTNVYSSAFTGNTTAARVLFSLIQNSTISGSAVGVDSAYGGATLRKNTITGNTIGIALGGPDSVTYNNIHSNSSYNVRYLQAPNQSLPNNWWGTTSTALIDAGIYDDDEQAGVGVVSFTPVGTVPVTLDTTPPDTTITSTPLDPSNTSSPSFSFTATDIGSTFACRIDFGPLTSCSSPKTYSGLSDGFHTFRVEATDTDANTDQSPASYSWTIDTAPPDTTILTGPSGSGNPTSAIFTWSATEPGSSVCSLDGAPFTVCTSPIGYTGLADGGHSFLVAGYDAAGNIDPSPAQRFWVVDGSPPIVTISRPAVPGLYVADQEIRVGTETPIVVGSLTVQAKATDAGSGVSSVGFLVDGVPVPGGQVTYNVLTGDFSFTWSGYTPGFHTIEARATDGGGRTGSTDVTVLGLIG